MARIGDARPPKQPRPHGKAKNEKFYNSKAWRDASKAWRLHNEPLCPVCMAMGILEDITPGTRAATDHIITIEAGGAMLDPRNFMGLCGPGSPFNHHQQKTALENSGLFVDFQLSENGQKIPAAGERERVIEIMSGVYLGV
jgi:hypothetical protein